MSKVAVYTLPFHWSRRVWITTSLYFVFAVTLVAMQIYLAVTHSVTAALGLLISLPILVAILIYCEGYSPQRLEISSEQITVLRRFNSVVIPRSTIVSITPIAQTDMSWTMTEGACGGLFGFFGTFRNRKLGRFTMYATTMENLYLIRIADGRKVVINCSEPDMLQKIA